LIQNNINYTLIFCTFKKNKMNSLILGDCLQALKNLPSESVDLCYIDPPFFSNRNYEVIWGDQGEVRSFEDRWSGGVDHYIGWLKERVQEIHRILKPTGSFYLHCDWHADAYIRVYILDKIFGEGNFQSHIVWRRTTAHGNAKQGSKRFEINFDTIFNYTKDKKFAFNTVYVPFKEEQIEKQYNKTDEKGRKYRLVTPTAAKGGGDTSYEFFGVTPPKGRYWAYSRNKLQEMYDNGLLYFSASGQPYIKYYLEDRPGVAVMSFWDDIKPMSPTSKERIGYPTQKPEKLLERIIKASSNEGDTVLDCFLGGGTTVAVADKLNRNWIGIDQSVQAIKVSEFRLNRQRNLFSQPFEVRLHKYDYDTLRYKDAFEFESWIVEQFGGQSNIKQRGDLGLDGKDKNGKPIQVKRSDGIGRNVIDNFVSAAKRYDKNLFEKAIESGEIIGTIIAFSFGKGAIQEAARLKNEDKILIDLIKVDEIIAIAKKPNVKLEIKLLEKKEKSESYSFIIKATADDGSQIEFYSFEINKIIETPTVKGAGGFDPEHKTPPLGGWGAETENIYSDYRNKTGSLEQELKTGKYKIIGKAIDNNGLEGEDSVEIVVG